MFREVSRFYCPNVAPLKSSVEAKITTRLQWILPIQGLLLCHPFLEATSPVKQGTRAFHLLEPVFHLRPGVHATENRLCWELCRLQWVQAPLCCPWWVTETHRGESLHWPWMGTVSAPRREAQFDLEVVVFLLVRRACMQHPFSLPKSELTDTQFDFCC